MCHHPPMSRAVGEQEDFERDGYAVFREVLDLRTVEVVRRHLAELQARHPDRRGEQFTHELMAGDATWCRIVADDRLLDVAECFLGPDLALFASHYIAKPPGDGQPVLWHQDAAYWPLDPMEVVTAWLAIDSSTTENGCMRVIPGSHRGPVLDVREGDGESVLGSEVAADVDETAAVPVELAPGDVSVHHPNLIHGSEANHSPHRRAGLTIRYIPTTTRILEPARGFPLLLRGRAVPGVNDYLEPPR
jgi:ectoine hydroxylase-related dioxygenase (phytanoyl-CoA dioxygenase family)